MERERSSPQDASREDISVTPAARKAAAHGHLEPWRTEKAGHASPGIAAGTSLAQISSKILGYQYVGVFALDLPDNRLRLLGVSGLTSEQEQRFRAATDHTPLTAYLAPTAIHQLSANQVVLLDVKPLPIAASSSSQKLMPSIRIFAAHTPGRKSNWRGRLLR